MPKGKPTLSKIPTWIWVAGLAGVAYLWWRHSQAAVPAMPVKGKGKGKHRQPAGNTSQGYAD